MKRVWKWGAVYCIVLALTMLTAQWITRAVTVLAEMAPLPRQHTIVIDAGHGGVDGGAVSCSGIPESRFNLEISLRLNDLFHLLGYDTRMIRTEDVSVYTKGETIAQKKVSDLKERVRIIGSIPNALLLSIHQNTFPDSQYRGAQVFYAGTPGSQDLAAKLQSAFTSTLNPGSRRQEKKSSGVYLMEQIPCTGALIECGFLSNREEEALLRSPDYQLRLCAVIACTVGEYLANT